MSYRKPNAFVTITIAEPAVPVLTPSFFPVCIAPHFFVAYKEKVLDAGKTYYEGFPLEDIAYPGLPKQSVNTNEYLIVDVGDLSPTGNDITGSPNIERFDPDVFIVTDDGAEVDISLAEGLNIQSNAFTIPGNLTYNAVTGLYMTTKGDIVDGNMAAEATTAWTPVFNTNTPVLAKDAIEKDYQNDYALKTTLNATPNIGDGFKSTAFTVIGGETYKAVIRAKKAETTGVNYDVKVFDEGADTLIVGAEVLNKSNTDYETIEIPFTVPSTCSSITIRVLAATATANGIFYTGSVHLLYTGADLLTGSILVSYRALEEKYSGARTVKLEASSIADLTALFGASGLSQANPLGYMMLQAYLHANITIRGIAVGNPPKDDGSSSYTGAITDEVISFTYSKDFMNQAPSQYFVIAPATQNEAVWDVFKAYTDALTATNKNWMRTVVGGKIDTQSTFLRGIDGSFCGMFSSAAVGGFTDGDIITYNGTDYTIRVVDGKAYVPLAFSTNQTNLTFIYNAVEYTDGVFVIKDAASVTMALTAASVTNFLASGYKKVKVNDTLLLSGVKYKVLIVRATILIVEFDDTIPEAAAGLNKVFSIYRYITLDGTSTGIPDKTTMAEMARDRAISYGNERFIICLPGWVAANINNEWTDVESWYAAAQLAAEMCLPVSLALGRGPGYPLGFGFTGLIESQIQDFHSSRYFNEDQLDIIGSGGNSILVNDNPGESLYLRHALTTDMSSIETQEIMTGTARDYVAYSFRQTMLSMIKRYRVAGPLASALKIRLEGLIRVLVADEQVVQGITITNIAAGATPDSVTVEGEITQYYPLNELNINLKIVSPTPFVVSI